MAVKIRLARQGSKKRPYYLIVAADSRSKRDGRRIEVIGKYNPLLAKEDPNRVVLNKDDYNRWVSCGAQPTDVVKRLFKNVDEQGKNAAKATAKAQKTDEKATQGAEANAKNIETTESEADKEKSA